MIPRLIVALVLASPAGLSADGPAPPAALTMAQVESLLGKLGIFIYDVNTPELWEQGHLPGAIYINKPNIKRFLPRDKNATLVFYCANRLCSASGAAAKEAMRLGYRSVFLMPEGIFGWERSGRPVETARHPD